SCFFFDCSTLHRDLHSFPTRRSSDLPPIVTVSTWRENTMKLFVQALVGSTLSAASLAAAATVTESDMLGSPAQASAAQRTIVIEDRKSTRLNSSHQIISYAVFCLKKK